MKRIFLAILAPALCLAFTACEDTITPMIQEEVRLAALPDRTLMILAPSSGTCLPSGTQTVKDGEPLDISATANSGFTFINWTQTAGAGTAAFEDATAATTRVRVTGGDATIQAVISDAIRQLTVQNDGHGTTVPSGAVSVGNGLQRNIQAIPDDAGGYQFLNWTKASGEGTVIFADANAASTTVSLSAGDATIRASFSLKQYVITLTSDGHGTTTPTGTLTLSHGIASGNLSTTPSAGYQFLNWTVTAGSGVTFSPNATTSTATITASGGNATVQANFELIPYTLTISAGIGGTVNPSGAVSVQSGASTAIVATPNGAGGYQFSGWNQTGGAGTAVFANASAVSTTVTVTGGDAAIQASFTLTPYTISLTNDSHGTTTPNGTLTLNHGIASGSISTTPSAGYQFKNWSVTVGSGIAFSPNATTSPATITATGGNATVQANFELIPYTLTINYGTGGWASPNGAQTVSYGVAFQLHAYPYGTYKFVNWTKASGAGTVVFSTPTDPNSTATVTDGNVSITANFVKKTLGLNQVGELLFRSFTTYPNNGQDIYYSNNYLYVLGEGTAGNSVVRKFNVTTPSMPTSVESDYQYFSGNAVALEGDGTSLYIATSSASSVISKLTISSFPSVSVVSSTVLPAYGNIRDLSIQNGGDVLWCSAQSQVFGMVSATLGGETHWMEPGSSEFHFIKKTPFTLLALREDTGAGDISSYNVDATGAASYYAAPTTSTLLYHGDSGDYGDSGRISVQVDGELVAIPTYDPYPALGAATYAVKIYGDDDPTNIVFRGEAPLSYEANFIHYDEYYIFAAGTSGGKAYLNIIDAYNPAAPFISKSQIEVLGFVRTDALYLNGTYLYAIVRPASGKPTLKIYAFTEN